MIRLLRLVMMVGVLVGMSGCGKDSSTGPSEEITEGPQGQTLEVKTEEWDNGNIKVEFQYYRDGGAVIKHGYYKSYYESGKVGLERNFVDGKQQGKLVSYYENGKVKKETNYKEKLGYKTYSGTTILASIEEGKFVEY